MEGRPTGPGRGIAARVARGASLSVVGNLGIRILGMASIAVLGRLLTPEDFGLVAIAMIFVALTEALANRQFDLALIRLPEVTPRHFDTAFTFALLWGLIAGGAIFLAADPAAAFLGEPGLAPVLHWLSLAPVLDGLRNPRFVEFQRRLAFLPEIMLGFAGKAAQALVSILLAVAFANHWAMVAGYLAFGATRLAVSYAARPARPRLSLACWRDFLGFGGWLSGTGFLTFLLQRSDTAIVGSTLGTAAVGLYNLGSELALMATHYLALPVTRTIYPGLAAVAGDPVRFRRAVRNAQEALLGLMLPVGIGTALTAHEIVVALVGTKWLGAVPVLMTLAPALTASLVVLNIQSVLMIAGDTRSMFGRNLVVALVQIPLLALGLWLLGLPGALLARVAAIALQTALTLRIAARVTGEPVLAPLLAARRSLVAAAAMAAAILLLDPGHPAPDTTPAALAAAARKVATGALVYGAVHLLLWVLAGRPEGFETRLLGPLMRRLRRRTAGPAGQDVPKSPQ